MGSKISNERHKIGTSPWRAVFNIIVSGHMLRNHGDAIGGIFGQEICSRQTNDTSSTPYIRLAYIRQDMSVSQVCIPYHHDVVRGHVESLHVSRPDVRGLARIFNSTLYRVNLLSPLIYAICGETSQPQVSNPVSYEVMSRAQNHTL